MTILSIGSDRNLFIKDSESQKRIEEYGKLFGGLHTIVFSKSKLGFKNLALNNNVFIYPTNHSLNVLFWWNVLKIATELIHKHNFSYITSQDPFENGLIALILKKIYRVPLQLQIHTDVFSPYFKKESLMNKIRVIIAKKIIPSADKVRVVSERIKRSLLNLGLLPKENIDVLPIFVDVEKIKNSPIKIDLHKKYPDHDFIILMASRLTKEKNIAMAIRAMFDLVTKHENNTNIRKPLLLIVGDGPESNNLQQTTNDLRLDNNVKFEPWTDELISYYKTADLFLLTSNYEGYGRTVIEAMAAGLPVVMTDVGLAGELLTNDLSGKIVSINNSQLLTRAILQLIENVRKREEFKLNASRVLENLLKKNTYLEKYKRCYNKQI